MFLPHFDSSFASRGIKAYSEGRLQFLKKMQEKSSQFLSSDQPSEPKSLHIAGVEKYARKPCDCGQPGGHSICVLNGTERQ